MNAQFVNSLNARPPGDRDPHPGIANGSPERCGIAAFNKVSSYVLLSSAAM
jgi:hypothetical protein